MLNLTKYVIVATIVALIIALAATQSAQAHTPNPKACTHAWRAADPGKRLGAKRRCLDAQYRHACIVHRRIVPGTVTVKGRNLRRGSSAHWRNQRKVIGWIVQEGLRRKLPRAVVLSALITTTQESSARELDGGHGTSVGPFQLINLHGSHAQRRSIRFSGDWYYNGAIRVYRRYRGNIDVVSLSHAVQRSRYPHAVAAWIPESTRTLRIVLGRCALPER